MKSCITTAHLYGMGGGAKTVFAIIRALLNYGPVTVFSRTSLPQSVIDEMPTGCRYAIWYEDCASGFDILFNVDHFDYARPLAGRNIAVIFHPNARNKPPEGYELFAISAYTAAEIKRLWGMESKLLYLPIESDYRVGRKGKTILNVARMAAPNQFADKGHRQMVEAFKVLNRDDWELVLAGSLDPRQDGYLSSIMAGANGYNISFVISPTRSHLIDLYSTASIYWHMTGVSMPKVSGAQEHLGLSTIEAMASGCLPIVRGSGGQLEVVRHGITGVLVDGVKDLVNMTSAIIDDLSVWAMVQQQATIVGRQWMGMDRFMDRFTAVMEDREPDQPAVIGLAPAGFTQYGRDDVDIIIPTMGANTVFKCLDSIPEGPNVILVNNGPGDILYHPRVNENIRLAENAGFAGGVMAGMERSTRPLVMTINDDCASDNPTWLDVMLVTIGEKDVGIIGPKLLYPNGRIQHAGIVLDFHRNDVGYHRYYGEVDSPAASMRIDVPAVTGACLMAKRELFDLRPDLYPRGNYEDAHACLNAWEKGYRVVYQPAAKLVHYEGLTKSGMDTDFVQHNRQTFIDQWRDKFLDDDSMAAARAANDNAKEEK